MRPLPILLVSAALFAACDGSHTPDAGASGLGAACSAEVPCGAGLSCITDPRFPGGYCSLVCSDGVCPAGGSCAAGSPPLCFAPCADGAGCRDGYQCHRGLCEPACASDASCDPTEQCALGECVPRGDGGATMLPEGAPCSADAECASGACLPPEAGGVCTIQCLEPGTCVAVEFDATCSPVITSAGLRTLCAPTVAGSLPLGRACARDSECSSRACQDGQCSGVCENETDCLDGQLCTNLPRGGTQFQGCGYAPAGGSITIEEIELGEHDVGAAISRDFELALPPDAVSLTLQARTLSGDPLDLSFVSVVDPRGTTLFDLGGIAELVDQPERWLPVDTAESITMLVPNTSADRIAFTGGVYRWSLTALPRFEGDTGSVRVRVSALVKRSATRSIASGFVDVNVFLVGVGVTAATAPSDTRLQTALSRLSTILDTETSVRLRNVAYFDVLGDDATRYAVLETTDGPTSELAGLFRLSGSRSGRALNLFLVRSINRADDGSFQALGIAGGIPGPVDEHGTMHGGVVATFDPNIVTARTVGHILAHEIGHYLGLYHATEQLRACGPGESPATASCAPFGAGDTLADTTRGDTSNLMYWSIVGDGANVNLSAGQGFVVRASALVSP